MMVLLDLRSLLVEDGRKLERRFKRFMDTVFKRSDVAGGMIFFVVSPPIMHTYIEVTAIVHVCSGVSRH